MGNCPDSKPVVMVDPFSAAISGSYCGQRVHIARLRPKIATLTPRRKRVFSIHFFGSEYSSRTSRSLMNEVEKMFD